MCDPKAAEKNDKNCFWPVQGGAVSLGCSVMPNSRLKIVGDEFLIPIDYYGEFHVNLLFDRSFIDRCAHIWVTGDTTTMITSLKENLWFHLIIDTFKTSIFKPTK